MTPHERLLRAVNATARSINDTDDQLRMFNEPEWPEAIARILAAARGLHDVHGVEPDAGIADDYANLFGILSQIDWPDDHDDSADPDRDDRLAMLRKSIGGLALDCFDVLQKARVIGLIPGKSGLDIPAGTLTDKAGREPMLRALVARLEVIEARLNAVVAPPQENGPRYATMVAHYQRVMRTNIASFKLAISTGPRIDLAVLERASTAMTGVTARFITTLRSAANLAGTVLTKAITAMGPPVGRLVRGVATLVKSVIRVETVLPPPPDDVRSETQQKRLGFISYSYQDREIYDALRIQLKATERAYDIEFWADDSVESGQNFNTSVANAIAAASVHILLTSSNSLWSDTIMDWEIPTIQKKRQADGDLVLPVVVDDCRWEGIAGTLLVSPRDDQLSVKPIKSWKKQSKALDCVRKELEAALSAHFGMIPDVSIPINDRENPEDEPIMQKDIRPHKLGEVARVLPDDFLEQAHDMILAGKVPPTHWSSHIKALDFGGTDLADIGPLAVMTALESLDLSETRVTDITALARLNALKSLDLSETQVTDITALARLNALESLALSRTRVSDITPLAEMNALSTLDLMSTQVSDIAPLENLTALEKLNLWSTQISDIMPLAGLNALKSLNLSRTKVSDITALAGLNALSTLELWSTQVSDIAPLAKLNALSSLGLMSTKVSDIAALSEISGLTVSAGSRKQANALRATLARGSTVVVET